MRFVEKTGETFPGAVLNPSEVDVVVFDGIESYSLPGFEDLFDLKIFMDGNSVDLFEANLKRETETKGYSLNKALERTIYNLLRSQPGRVEQFKNADIVINRFERKIFIREKTPGGIDLNPGNMDLQRQGTGFIPSFEFYTQPVQDINFEGLLPVIINITPVTNVPFLLGVSDQGGEDGHLGYEPNRPIDDNASLSLAK